MISAEHSSEQPDLFAYEEVEPLIAALGDPEEAVRIAVLRVLLRLGKYLDQRTIEEVRLHAQYELSRAELEYITYLPSEAVLSRLLRDLERFGRAVHEFPVPEDYDEESFQHLSTEEASRLITEHFAALASEKIPYAHWSDIREGAGDGIAGQVSRLGSKFKPDISALSSAKNPYAMNL